MTRPQVGYARGMPAMKTKNRVRKSELPATIRKSSPKAQRTWAKTHDAAVKQYGEGERAHRTAFQALKHSFERVSDHWEPKRRPGPSDPRTLEGGERARRGAGRTFGGVDYFGHTKDELYARAKRLGIAGRSHMSKAELATAIAKRQRSR